MSFSLQSTAGSPKGFDTRDLKEAKVLLDRDLLHRGSTDYRASRPDGQACQ